jgi:large subunit ribosomal protein L4
MLFVVDALGYEQPKTKTLAALIEKLGLEGKKVLLLTGSDAAARNVYLSGRNIPKVHVMRFADTTAYEILWSHAVIVELTALGEAEQAAEESEHAEEAADA